MVKLVALYARPADPEAFDRHYHGVHLGLVRAYPGLRKLEVTRVTGAPIGEASIRVMAEMYFDDKNAMESALASPAGKAVTRDLLSFAASIVTVFFGEVEA